MAGVWSKDEIELITADYLSMLRAELTGEIYNKAEHRRALRKLLTNRSEQSIEWKHQNITAVLLEAGFPAIDGYKPARNYQRYQFPQVVLEHATHDLVLAAAIETAVQQRTDTAPSLNDILTAMVNPPERPTNSHVNETRAHPPITAQVDYLSREAANLQLGIYGEKFIVNFEKARLIAAGADSLAEKIEHASVEQGNGLGYDIRSYEVDGTDRFIEVKTTRFSRYTPFYISPRELEFSHEESERYQLYRLFNFSNKPSFFALHGKLNDYVTLKATQFLAYV